MIRFAETLGVDTIKFTNFHPVGNTTERPLYNTDPKIISVLNKVAAQRNYKVNILLPSLYGDLKPPYYCRMLSSIVIGSNGDYAPCCRIAPDKKWGNFFESRDKHNSDMLKRFRLSVIRAGNQQQLPCECRECAHLSPERLGFSARERRWYVINRS
jgi:radical SAM protein with 4Fe4S-binding SPASM domain